jgi:hypothetical protein
MKYRSCFCHPQCSSRIDAGGPGAVARLHGGDETPMLVEIHCLPLRPIGLPRKVLEALLERDDHVVEGAVRGERQKDVVEFDIRSSAF